MLEISLIFLVVAAIGAVCYWRRPSAKDRSAHTVITEAHNESAPLSLTNLPQGSRLGMHSGRSAALLKDGSVMAQSAGGTKTFATLAAYRDFVGDQRALQFADLPA
jgi:hypothetical protein